MLTQSEIDTAYDRNVARHVRNGNPYRITREQYREWAVYQAWIANIGTAFGDDRLVDEDEDGTRTPRKGHRSFEFTDQELSLPRVALLSWLGRAPKPGEEVLTMHVDEQIAPPEKISYLRRWRVIRVADGVGVSVSDTAEDDDIDTGDPVTIRRLLCQEISG